MDAGTKLWIGYNSELDESTPTVKTITPEGSHVTAGQGGSSLASGATILLGGTSNVKKSHKATTDADVILRARADDGYQISGITYVYKKDFGEGNIVDETVSVDHTGTPLASGASFVPTNAELALTVPVVGFDQAKNATWKAKSVKVQFATEAESLRVDRTVEFKSEGVYTANLTKGAYTFTVKTESGKVEKVDPRDEDDQKYVVKKGASYLEFTVDADSAPTVKVGGVDVPVERVGASGYTYRAPATALADGATITIKRQSKNVRFLYTGGAADVTFEKSYDLDAGCDTIATPPALASDSQTVDGVTYPYSASNGTVAVGAKIRFVVKKPTGAGLAIASVSYKLGKNQAVPVPVGTDGNYTFEVRVTDNLDILIKKDTGVTALTVEQGGRRQPLEEDGAYHLSYNGAIKAYWSVNGIKATLYTAKVWDVAANKTAATSAKLVTSDTEAEINVRAAEQGKLLKVTLVKNDDKTTREFFLITDTTVGGVTYGEAAGLSAGALTMPVDSKVEIPISLNEAGASFSQLGVAIVGKDDEKALSANINSTATQTKNNLTSSVSAQLNATSKKLEITAAPTSDGKGAAEPVRIVLFNQNDTDTDKAILANSSILVTTKDAAVLTAAVTAGAESSTARELRVKLGSTAELDTPNLNKTYYYKVTLVEKPALGAYKSVTLGGKEFSASDVKAAVESYISAKMGGGDVKYFKKSDIDKDGGLKLPVMPDTLGLGADQRAFPGMEVSGFKFKAALAQTYGDPAPASATDANTFTGPACEFTLGTKAPYYENTGSEGKLLVDKTRTNTILTGDDTPVVVAVPKFSGTPGYRDVEADFVNTKTGLPVNVDMTADYDPLENQVVVSSNKIANNGGTATDGVYRDSYTPKGQNLYKDLGVKITAASESTGYGASAIVPIKVVNGAENINVDVQPFIKLDSKKGGSAKAVASLNELGTNNYQKAWAPKNKGVAYFLLPQDATLGNFRAGLYDSYAMDGVSVNAKTGAISVSRDFAINRTNTTKNKFIIGVKSADGVGFNISGAVEIVDTDQPLEVAIFKKGADWNSATLVTGSRLEVTETGAEYRIVVLKDGIALDHKSYDVNETDGGAVIRSAAAYAFGPIKGNVLVDKDGYIKVGKLGRATLTVTDRSNPKNVYQLPVEFAASSRELSLEIVQFSDSSLKSGVARYAGGDFDGANTTYFGLNVVDAKTKEALAVNDVSLSFDKKTKNITPGSAAEWNKRYSVREYTPQYLIAATGNEAKISFKRGGAVTTYTLVNKSFQTAKAPKAALADSKQAIREGEVNTVSYKLSAKNTDLAGSYVRLSLDANAKNPDGKDFTVDGESFLDRVLPVDDDSTFSIKVKPSQASPYYLNVSVGSMEGGVFTPAYADAKLTVKVTKAPAARSVTATGSYTIYPYAEAAVAFKTNVAAWFNESGYTGLTAAQIEAVKDKNWAKNAIVDNEENRFSDFFEIKADSMSKVGTSDRYRAMVGTIGVKSTVSVQDLNNLMTNPDWAKHLTGWVTVMNGTSSRDVKVTVKLKEGVGGLKAVATPVVAGSSVSTLVTLTSGGEEVAVESFTTDSGVFVADGLVGKKLRLKGVNVSKGAHSFNLNVTPKSTPNFCKGQSPVTVAVPVKVTAAAANLANKVAFAKGGNVWNVGGGDYHSPDEAHSQGFWQRGLAYSFKNALSLPENAEITAEGEAKYGFLTFESSKYALAGGQILTATIDKAKFAEAIDGKNIKYGGKLTVKVAFSYGEASGLKGDSVNVTINLPAEPESDNAKAVEAIKGAKAIIQNTVESVSRKNYDELGATGNYAAKNEALRSAVRSMVMRAAGSATLKVTVTDDGTETGGVTSQAGKITVAVADAAGTKLIDPDLAFLSGIGSGVNKTVGEMQTALEAYNGWGGVSGWTKEEQALFTLTKDTAPADYAAMVAKILTKRDGMTPNISVGYRDEEIVKPTEREAGYYNITFVLRDSSKSPDGNTNNTGVYERTVDIMYVLDQVEGVTSAIARVVTALQEDADYTTKLVGKAWDETATLGLAVDDGIVKAEYRSNLEAKLLAAARDLLAKGDAGLIGNESLSVKGLQEGSLALTHTASSSTLAALSYTLIFEDKAPDAKQKEIYRTVTMTGTDSVAEWQTEAELKTAVEKGGATAITCIPRAATEEEVIKLTKEKIESVKKNKALDLTNLKAELEKAAGKIDNFTPASGSKNGIADITVTWVDTANGTSALQSVVILASGTDFAKPATGTDAAIQTAYVENKIKSLVLTELSAERIRGILEKRIKGMADGTNWSAPTGWTNNDIMPLLATAVDTALTNSGAEYEMDGGSANAADIAFTDSTTYTTSTKQLVPQGGLETVSIPEFSVKLQKKGATTTRLNVLVPAMVLAPIPAYQTLAQAEDALKRNAKVRDGFTVRNNSVTFTAGSGASGSLSAATDVESVALGVLRAEEVVTGALLKLEVKDNTTDHVVKAAFGDYAGSVEKMNAEVSERNGQNASDYNASTKKKVPIGEIKMLTAAKTPGAVAVNLKSIDGAAVTTNGSNAITQIGSQTTNIGAASATAYAVTTPIDEVHDKIKVYLDKVVTETCVTSGTALWNEYQGVTWKVENAYTSETPGARALSGITWKEISDSTGKGIEITVSKDTATNNTSNTNSTSAGNTIMLKVTATANKESKTGTEIKRETYINLTTKPTIKSIQIEGPKTIELDSTGKNSTAVTGYKAVVTGTFLNEYQKTHAVGWTTDGHAASPAVGSPDNDGTLTVTDSSTAATKTSIKLTATVSTTSLPNHAAMSKDYIVNLVKAPTAGNGSDATKDPYITLGSAEGAKVEAVTRKDGTKYSKITVTGERVRIPLSINLNQVNGAAARNWNWSALATGGVTADTSLGTLSAVPTVGTVGSTAGVRIETGDNKAWLVVDDALSEQADEQIAADGTVSKKADLAVTFDVSSTGTAANGSQTVKTQPFKAIIVVEKGVRAMRLEHHTDTNPATGAGMTSAEEDDGTGNLTDYSATNAAQYLWLRAAFDGNHIPAAEAEKVSYSISYKDRSISGATGTEVAGTGAFKIMIPASGYGAIEVTAEYGEGEKKITQRRIIQVAKWEMVESSGGTRNLDIEVGQYDGSNNAKKSYKITDGTASAVSSGITWSVSGKTATGTSTAIGTDAVGKHIKIKETSGVLEIEVVSNPADAATGNSISAGEYPLSLEAAFTVNGVSRVIKRYITLTVKKAIDTIVVPTTVAGLDLTGALALGTLTYGSNKFTGIANNAAGRIVIPVSITTTRGTPEPEDLSDIAYTITTTGSNVTAGDGTAVGTATTLRGGKAEIVIGTGGLGASKTITVEFNLKASPSRLCNKQGNLSGVTMTFESGS